MWRDAGGHTCNDYVERKWCQNGAYGPGWKNEWGLQTILANRDGSSAIDQCCECMDPKSEKYIIKCTDERSKLAQIREDTDKHVEIFTFWMAIGSIPLCIYILIDRRINAKRNWTDVMYFLPISAYLGIYDMGTDVMFCSYVNQTGIYPYVGLAATIDLILSCIVSGIVVVSALRNEMKNEEVFLIWYKEHMGIVCIIGILSCTNFKYLGLIVCRVGRIAALNAPISEKFKERLVFWGVISNIIEDIPQLCLQSYVMYQEAISSGYISQSTSMSMAASALALVFEIVQRCKYFCWRG